MGSGTCPCRCGLLGHPGRGPQPHSGLSAARITFVAVAQAAVVCRRMACPGPSGGRHLAPQPARPV